MTMLLTPNDSALSTSGWYLEGRGLDGRAWFIQLKQFPFTVGRSEGCDLRLSFPEISRRHAEIVMMDEVLVVREFGSTNGTFVNSQRISGSQRINSGDILHFGAVEFRVLHHAAVTPNQPVIEQDLDATCLNITAVPQSIFTFDAQFAAMLQTKAVLPYYQPLVSCHDERVIGYELLGRGSFEGLPSSPGPLFQIARTLDKETELSTLFREIGIAKAQQLNVQLFFNTVPKETNIEFLRQSLPQLRLLAPQLPMTMEIHEAAVTNPKTITELRALLAELDIGLAYDDFGAGQARLLELIESPPDVLKFDIALIRNLHLRPAPSRQAIAMLVKIAHDLGIATLAEGTELREEVDACIELGFDYLQGYYFGKPAPEFKGSC